MKFFSIALTLVLAILSTQTLGDVILHSPKGEYATINVEDDSYFIQILNGLKRGNKAEIAKKIDAHPGNYAPPTLQALGEYYMKKKNFKKGTFYYRAAIFRAGVDIKAARDKTLADALPMMITGMRETAYKLNMTPSENAQYQAGLKEATQKLIAWDRRTPRNYDIRWACLHSLSAFSGRKLNFASPKEYNKILQNEYKQFIITAKKDGLM